MKRTILFWFFVAFSFYCNSDILIYDKNEKPMGIIKVNNESSVESRNVESDDDCATYLVQESAFSYVKNNNLNGVKCHIESGFSPNEKDKYQSRHGLVNTTLLNIATENNNIQIADYLIKSGANVNGKDSFGYSPIIVATLNSNIDLIGFLLDNGANVNTRTDNQMTPLHFATRDNKLQIADFLLQKGAMVNFPDSSGCTPLYFSVLNDRFDIFKLLIEKGADIDAKSGNNLGRRSSYTPLHLASELGRVDMVKYLVEKNADINSLSLNRSTPLQVTISGKNVRDKTGNNDKNSNEIVGYLLEKGAVVNNRNESHKTALSIAISKKKSQIVQMLLKKGARQ